MWGDGSPMGRVRSALLVPPVGTKLHLWLSYISFSEPHHHQQVIRVPQAEGGLSLPERNRWGQEGRENGVEQKANLHAGPGGDMP